jgi:hypothetical protein
MKWISAPALLLATLASVGPISQSAYAEPSAPLGAHGDTVSSGQQGKPSVEPGSIKVASEPALGPTQFVQVSGTTAAPKTEQRADAGVGLYNALNYCYGAMTYTPVYNNNTTSRHFMVVLNNQSQSRHFYGSVAAGGTFYVPFSGVRGDFSAYLYVWNGSAYRYDDYRVSNNRCDVTVTAVCSSTYPGWVQEVLKNNGTAYASVQTYRSQPTPQASYYDYPIAGGEAVTRWVKIRESTDTAKPFVLAVSVLGSYELQQHFTGNC